MIEQRHTLFAPAELTADGLERALRGWGAYAKKHSGWDPSLPGSDGLLFDLSRVIWSDFGALARVLLLVEGAARHGIRTQVLLPMAVASDVERELMDDARLPIGHRGSIAARVRERASAMRFLESVGFTHALQMPHLIDDGVPKPVVSFAAAEPSQGVAIEDGSESVDTLVSRPSSAGRIIPFAWITEPEDADSQEDVADQIARLLRLGELGLRDRDARSVARGIAWELLENVWDHADEGREITLAPPGALLGAIVLNSGNRAAYAPRAGDFPEGFAEFGDWLNVERPPLFRVLIGDSGVSIPTTLEPVAQSQGALWTRPPIDRDLDETEELLFFSLASVSSCRGTSVKRGVRGLALVDRLVRAFGGVLKLRSQTADVGFAYPPRRRLVSAQNRLRLIPGTIVEASLCGGPLRRGQVRGRAIPESASIAVVELAQQSEAALLSQCQAAITGLEAPTLALVCTADTLTSHVQDVANRLARLAVEMSSQRVRVALVTPDFNSAELLPHLKAYEDAWAAVSEKDLLTSLGIPTVPEPILVISGDGELQWWGGGDANRRALYELLESPGAVLDQGMIEAISSDYADDGLESSVLMSDWVSPDGENLRFGVDPRSVVWAAVRRASELLAESAKREDGAGGVAYTPAAELVARWIDLPDVLGEQPLLSSMLTFACMETLRVSRIDDEAVQLVVGVSDSVRSLADQLALVLGVESAQVEGERVPRMATPGSTQSPGILLVADVVNSAETLTSTGRRLIKDGGNLLGVIAAIETGAEKRNVVEVLGRRIPFVALAHVPADAGRLEQLESTAASGPDLGELEKDLHPMVAGPNLPVWFSHVVRRTGRHFSAYFNPADGLEPGGAVRSAISEQLLTEMIDWYESLDPSARVQVLFPSDDALLAGQGASQLAEVLEARLDRPVVTRGVARTAESLPTMLAGSHIIVFDWGAVTSRTLVRLLTAAIAGGAKSVAGVVLLSQIAEVDRGFFSTIGAVWGPELVEPEQAALGEVIEPAGQVLIPARVAEAVSLRLPHWESEVNCDHCRVLRELDRLSRSRLPALIRQANEAKLLALAGRRREDLWSSIGQTDLYGAPLSGLEARRALALYGWVDAIREKPRTAPERYQLRRLLEELGDSADPLDWLVPIRSLLLRPSLVKQDPMQIGSIRDALAQCCLRILESHRYDVLRDAHLLQAAVVLRIASKQRFLASFPDLLLRHAGHPSVAAELLHGMLTYLRRDYHQEERPLGVALAALKSARLKIVDSPEAIADRLQLLESVDYLIAEGELRRSRATVEQDLAIVWHKAKRDYQAEIETHHGIQAAVGRAQMSLTGAVMSSIIDSSLPAPDSFWAWLLEDWERSETFLLQVVLPKLELIRPCIEGSFLRLEGEDLRDRDFASTSVRDALAQASSGSERLEALSSIRTELQGFAGGAEASPASIDSVRDQMTWWFRNFLLCYGEDRSSIFSVLDKCPGDLWGALNAPRSRQGGSLLEQWRASVPAKDESLSRVFCPLELMRDVLGIFLDNAGDHRIEGGPSPEFEIDVGPTIDGKHVEVRVFNTNSDRISNVGRRSGLRGCSDRLSAFEASVQEIDCGPSYTFGVRLRMRLWNME